MGSDLKPQSDVRLPSRVRDLPRVGSRTMDDRIAALRLEGKEVLPLSAYPTRPLPQDVLEEARASMTCLTHAPTRGLTGLRQALAQYGQERTGRNIDSDQEVLVTGGA